LKKKKKGKKKKKKSELCKHLLLHRLRYMQIWSRIQ